MKDDDKVQRLVEALEKVSRELMGSKRRELEPEFKLLSAELGLDPSLTQHLSWPLPSWPKRGEASSAKDSVLRYLVDFGHGDRPDHHDYLATFEEVRKLLNYTRDSCKVAFGTSRGKIDRTQRATRLGPCVIFRLPAAVDISAYPLAKRLSDREELLNGPTQAAGGKKSYVRGNKY